MGEENAPIGAETKKQPRRLSKKAVAVFMSLAMGVGGVIGWKSTHTSHKQENAAGLGAKPRPVEGKVTPANIAPPTTEVQPQAPETTVKTEVTKPPTTYPTLRATTSVPERVAATRIRLADLEKQRASINPEVEKRASLTQFNLVARPKGSTGPFQKNSMVTKTGDDELVGVAHGPGYKPTAEYDGHAKSREISQESSSEWAIADINSGEIVGNVKRILASISPGIDAAVFILDQDSTKSIFKDAPAAEFVEMKFEEPGRTIGVHGNTDFSGGRLNQNTGLTLGETYMMRGDYSKNVVISVLPEGVTKETSPCLSGASGSSAFDSNGRAFGLLETGWLAKDDPKLTDRIAVDLKIEPNDVQERYLCATHLILPRWIPELRANVQNP